MAFDFFFLPRINSDFDDFQDFFITIKKRLAEIKASIKLFLSSLIFLKSK